MYVVRIKLYHFLGNEDMRIKLNKILMYIPLIILTCSALSTSYRNILIPVLISSVKKSEVLEVKLLKATVSY